MAYNQHHIFIFLALLVLSVMVCECTSKCKLQTITHKAVQTDKHGRRCWDDVNVVMCQGYCRTHEIPDWQFPYRRSNHQVCVPDLKHHVASKLKFCDPGVEPGTDVYHHWKAGSCSCQICSSEDTSCEWLPPNASILDGLVPREESDDEFDE